MTIRYHKKLRENRILKAKLEDQYHLKESKDEQIAKLRDDLRTARLHKNDLIDQGQDLVSFMQQWLDSIAKFTPETAEKIIPDVSIISSTLSLADRIRNLIFS
jgi:hypothetical protein